MDKKQFLVWAAKKVTPDDMHTKSVGWAGCSLCHWCCTEHGGQWTKWSRFEVRPSTREELKQHRRNKVHQLALAKRLGKSPRITYQSPTVAKYRGGRKIQKVDPHSFGIGAPTLSDHAWAWAASQVCVSAASVTKLRKLNAKPKKMSPAQKNRILSCQAGAWQARARAFLAQCNDIGLSADGKKKAQCLLYRSCNWTTLDIKTGWLS